MPLFCCSLQVVADTLIEAADAAIVPNVKQWPDTANHAQIPIYIEDEPSEGDGHSMKDMLRNLRVRGNSWTIQTAPSKCDRHKNCGWNSGYYTKRTHLG